MIHSGRLKELFERRGDKRRAAFSVQHWTGFSPNMYRKVEWAKRVICIWRQNVRYNMMEPYPAMPPEKHASAGARLARSRGGIARAAAIRRRKRGKAIKT